MASFFQPPSSGGDPAVEFCNGSDFRVYCNSLLPADHRSRHWAQKVNLVVAAIALGLPLLLVFFSLLVRRWRVSRPKRPKARPKHSLGTSHSPSSLSLLESLRSVRTFRFHLSGIQPKVLNASTHDLHIVDLWPAENGCGTSPLPYTAQSSTHSWSSKVVLGYVDLNLLGTDPILGSRLEDTVDLLLKLFEGGSINGLILRPLRLERVDEALGDDFNALLEQLGSSQIPALAICHHDDPVLNDVDLDLLEGIIIENSCILRNGKRRDFFRSGPLRHMVAACSKQQAKRPSFFMGFLDLWDRQPSPAVVRRAVKLAQHFGAIYEHSSTRPTATCADSPSSLSGFEYLRRPETSELQKAWIRQDRKVHIVANLKPSTPDIAPLDLGELSVVLPNARELLTSQPLPEYLVAVQSECPQLASPPQYVELIPQIAEFWESSCNNESFSSFGCFPIITGASQQEYENVVETQAHLKDLNMLERLQDAEVDKIIEQLQVFRNITQYPQAVEALVDSLTGRATVIYRGLSTGFRVSDSGAQFWGVSSPNENCIDIFISMKSPNVVSTVLHIWLAANQIPRVERFEEELRLEMLKSSSSVHSRGLPVSITAEMERATPNELLFLLQRLRLAKTGHPLVTAMQDFCEYILLDCAEDSAWIEAHSRRYWEGEVDMCQLIQLRLKKLVQSGARELPTLENLVQLHAEVESLVHQSLFVADRGTLNAMTAALLHAYDPWTSWSTCDYVDINADLFALIFFAALRKAALDDVYLEATDRCPFFLSQPDQAAVFSELWSVGSQCHGYFGILPRDLGQYIYNRYQKHLEADPPPAKVDGCGLMTCYANPADIIKAEEKASLKPDEEPYGPSYDGYNQMLRQWKERAHEFGALSIFCFPAMIDVVLLTFVGRGLFVTAFMDLDSLEMGCYALLISLLLAAGVTGWVGSTGSYYLGHYAYDNMILFHVQRFSGGFILTMLVGVAGLAAFSVERSVAAGFIFLAYLVAISTYLYLMGIMATMHQRGSPLTSGRTVLWRTIPLLFISPILSSLVNGHDLKIYLPVIYGFLIAVLVQYRKLCHEWSTWLVKVPTFQESDIEEWYSAKLEDPSSDSTSASGVGVVKAEPPRVLAERAFRESVQAYSQLRPGATVSDPVVSRAAKGLRYAQWLLQKTHQDGSATPEIFSTTWFAELQSALKMQQQLSRGLKEHSVFMLFRFARLDIGQSVALFLICLMDHWVDIITSARDPNVTVYIDFRARYGIGLCILYFCASVIALDSTLYPYWADRGQMSEEKLSNPDHARIVERQWEWYRRSRYFQALYHLSRKLLFLLGVFTILLWLLVDNPKSILLYWLYVLGYTGVMLFQFNRCFTTDVATHLTVTCISAMVGLVCGCILQAVPATRASMYNNVIALDIAAVLAAILTFVWVFFDFRLSKAQPSSTAPPSHGQFRQKRLMGDTNSVLAAEPLTLPVIRGEQLTCNSSDETTRAITSLLKTSLQLPNEYSRAAPWSRELLKLTLGAWLTENIILNIVTRNAMVQHGQQEVFSFSSLDSGVLQITAGFLDEIESADTGWQLLLGVMLAECILHHASRALLNHDNTHAVQAEHFLSGTEYLSRRIDFELATVASSSLQAIKEKTISEVLRHLCLNVDVDACWEELPTAARRAILCRVIGRQVPMSWEFGQWIEEARVDQQATDFHLDLSIGIYQRTLARMKALPQDSGSTLSLSSGIYSETSFESPLYIQNPGSWASSLRRIGVFFTHVLVTTVRWISIITGAGSDVERELWFCLRNFYFRDTLLAAILFIWKTCWLIKNGWVYALMIYHRSALVNISRLARKGASRVLKKNTIVVELPRKVITGFASENDQGTLTLEIFVGRLDAPPASTEPSSVAVYDEDFRLKSRTDEGDTGKRVSTYEYDNDSISRWPCHKDVVQGSTLIRCRYDGAGRISHGTLNLASTSFTFQYSYKLGAKDNSDILKADYRLAHSDSRNSITVYWGSPARGGSMAKWAKRDWVPSDRVCCVMRFIDGKTYVTTWEYLHRRDPIVTTFLQEGESKTVVTDVPCVFEEEGTLLIRPTNVSFEDDDLLLHHHRRDLKRLAAHTKAKSSVISRLNPLSWSYDLQKARYHPVPTWWLRSELWNHWLTSGTVDAVTACWMDEVILREEPLLQGYWRARDFGRLSRAREALDSNIEQIVAAIEIEREVSEMCLLPIKAADLYAMGLSKDANEITNQPQNCFRDTKDRISVIFNDIGCWPEAPGGVSNCRRDLINGHSTIRNHVLVEAANDYGVPRFQIEKSVQSLKLLPLWGVDNKTPNHGIIDNLLQSQVDKKIRSTDIHQDVAKSFIPLLKLFVKGARSKEPSRSELQQYSQCFIALSNYFEKKDYNTTWQSREVMNAWVEAWLTPHKDGNMRELADYFEIEQPSMRDFHDSLAIYSSYFFIFSVQVPEECPRVFQSTHHGISSLFGLILKYRRGVTFGIWDHAILWRECCLNISPAQSSLSIPVQSMLLAGIGLATRLAYFHADVILPCTSVFNPVWEAELGTDRGRLGHRNQFSRKIDPIVNGISDMESFNPVDKVESKTPTVVMLSNVQFIKDIKAAVMAADIIVNKFGFTDYKLLIYGSQDRQPAYAIEMSKLIAAYKLSEHVTLAGFGSPRDVLRSAWLFMNSSISEGLPLAIGEAALAGVPIVATEVGSTALVLTDPDDATQRYGEVVPPNDHMALARAQLSILAMVGPWSRFTSDAAATQRGSRHAVALPDVITDKDVEWVTRRMYDRSEDRRKLGLRARDVVLRSFHGNRYLREHEQMYWIQWHMARMRADMSLSGATRALRCVKSYPMLRYIEAGKEVADGDGGDGVRRKRSLRWQDFPSRERRRGRRLSKQKTEASGIVVTVEEV